MKAENFTHRPKAREVLKWKTLSIILLFNQVKLKTRREI
jgi:hypothetical protein